MLSISFDKLLRAFFSIALFWIFTSLIYFGYTNNKNDRRVIFSMWKVYYPTLIFMFAFIFNVEANIRNIKAEYFKTKLLYEIKTNVNIQQLKDTFSNYKRFSIESIDFLEPNEVNLTKEFSQNKQSSKDYKILYGNLGVGIMIITTLFMILWAVVELSLFKVTDAKSSKFKKFVYRHKIKSSKCICRR